MLGDKGIKKESMFPTLQNAVRVRESELDTRVRSLNQVNLLYSAYFIVDYRGLGI